ncbi:helix-turn-helix transcriptional regulator [Arachidicoccus soli]|nr:helix-turn-helix transcriptional regulator [Arachidicoccus soli]
MSRRREFLSLKQEDLAEMAQVTIKTIYMIESGKGNPGFGTLFSSNKMQFNSLMKIDLSDILYSFDHKSALVYLNYSLFPGQSHRFLWAYPLENKNKKWVIKKAVGTPGY